MNIQGGVQDFTQHSQIAINTSGRVKSLPKIAKFIDHYTSGLISLFVHLDNHLYITGSLHQSLTGWYVCIIVSISATGLFGYLEVDLGLIVRSHWIHLL